ncbi:uncharacterized protein L201_002298 [Kwoniella dendrophila CBS 6074]|uniref:Uncharacterized protein n=1 Tax=Kwoniella dendrophila CBS 6074 TaxID=1295534 RepID=A0AAX4JRB3_9TREE
MPAPLPSITPPEGFEPDKRDPLTIAIEQHLDDVRQWTEWITNGDPSGIGMVDYGIYRTFEEWVKRKEALNIIDSILQKRLTLGWPYDHKAIILIQILPSERLAPYAKLLEPLLPPKPSEDPAKPINLPAHFNPLIATLAQSLYTTAKEKAKEEEETKKKADEKKKEEEEIEKWELWSNMYGKSRANWFNHPGNPQWGYWEWNQIGKEDWWKDRSQ